MEFNPQKAEKSEQIRWSSEDQVGAAQVRSYTCAFCKKGFSNAQALGGHMNVHRRDRAKLKQSFEENLLSLEISIKNTADHDQPQQPLEEKILFRLDSGDQQKHATSNHRKPCTSPDKDDHARGKAIGAAELPQLTLFVGRPTPSNEMREGGCVVERIHEEKKTDLDLELRLGPEPQEAPTSSTREFF